MALASDTALHASSVHVPSLKLAGLPIRQIGRTSALSISRPGDLDLLTSK